MFLCVGVVAVVIWKINNSMEKVSFDGSTRVCVSVHFPCYRNVCLSVCPSVSLFLLYWMLTYVWTSVSFKRPYPFYKINTMNRLSTTQTCRISCSTWTWIRATHRSSFSTIENLLKNIENYWMSLEFGALNWSMTSISLNIVIELFLYLSTWL